MTERISWIEDVLAERELGLPPGVLRQGHVDWRPCNYDAVTWGPRGGSITCERDDLAALVAEALTPPSIGQPALFAKLESTVRSALSDASCVVYLLYYNAGSVGGEIRHDVVSIPACELPREPRENETFVGIRDRSQLVSLASALPRYEVNGHRFYWIGVQTDPAHRRRGLAKACIHAMQKEMGANSVAIWQCRASNPASTALAESIGYVHLASTFVWGQR